jgi:hypothetical protein
MKTAQTILISLNWMKQQQFGMDTSGCRPRMPQSEAPGFVLASPAVPGAVARPRHGGAYLAGHSASLRGMGGTQSSGHHGRNLSLPP